MIPDEMIEAASRWLAEQHWEPLDDRCNVTPATLREYYYRQANRKLTDVADRNPGSQRFGACVPCRPGRSGDGLPTIATVKLFLANPSEWCVFGYLPGEIRPSFIHPMDLNLAYRARWAVQDVRERADSRPRDR